MKNLRGLELIGAVIVFFILLFGFTKIVGPIPFTVNNINTSTPNPFEASGTGKASAAPDTAVINMGVTQTGATVKEAQTKTNQIADQIISGLKNLGIEEKDIKTTNYSVNPEYSFSAGSQKITGYSVTQNFEVKSPIDKANQVVDAATLGGANLVGGISFTLEDEKMEELMNEARNEAVEKAKTSAEGLANAAGIKLGKIINIQESFGSTQPVPVFREAALDASAKSEPETQITAGESNVEVTVILTYQTF